jgi:multiple sugar transport system substrate-binding protein
VRVSPTPAAPRRRVTLVWLLCMAVLAAGCDGDPQPLTNDRGGELVFATGRDVSQGRQWEAAVAAWNATHDPDVRMVELPESADLQRTELVAVAQEAAGRFDVLNLDVIWTAEFARNGYLLDLDPWIGEADRDDFLPKPRDTATWDGRLWAVPFDTNVGLLFYRTDLLAARGWDPPGSWADLVGQAREINAADLTVTGPDGARIRVTGYAGQLARYEGLTVNALEAIWDAGGRLTDDSGTKVQIDEAGVVKGLANLAQGVREGWIDRSALGFTEQPAREAFENGQLAFMRNWPYVSELLDAEGSSVSNQFDAVPLPWPSALGGHNLAISKHSRRQRAALEFIRFLTSRDNQVRFLVEGGLSPTRRSAYTGSYDNPSDDQPAAPVEQLAPYASAALQGLDQARLRPVTPYYTQVTEAIQTAVFPVLDGGASPESAAEELAQTLPVAFEGRRRPDPPG